MSVIIAIFMGLTVSAEEIIKDRKILKREAFLNLSWNSYLMSKVFVQMAISAIQALTFVIIGNLITGIRGMWFEYWLVLFACWTGANIMGLIISDSFKAVATIYMWIPFLVIPQIILSGIMVKFEKLNPNLSSPVEIPWYGNIITARWGYEALAVKQFKDNRYERQFYIYDKAMSKAKFKKDYWVSKVKGYLDGIENELERGTRSNEFEKRLTLVYNEIKKEQSETPELRFEHVELLKPDKITPEIAGEAINYVESLRRYYILYSNNAKDRKEALMTKLESQDSKAFLKMKFDYTNEALKEFVTNEKEMDKIIEYKGEIIQKLEPIYMDPKHNFIKAHFYAPTKKLFGLELDTFVMNVIVLWFIAIVLYLALYFRLLKKFLDSGEVAMGKKLKGSE